MSDDITKNVMCKCINVNNKINNESMNQFWFV